MCGICGVVSVDTRQVEPAVRCMMQAMVHRGPDDDGFVELPLAKDESGSVVGLGFPRATRKSCSTPCRGGAKTSCRSSRACSPWRSMSRPRGGSCSPAIRWASSCSMRPSCPTGSSSPAKSGAFGRRASCRSIPTLPHEGPLGPSQANRALTEHQVGRLKEILQHGLKSFRAHLLREAVQPFWKYSNPERAMKFFDVWCTRTVHSRSGPMKKIARSLRRHRYLILN